MRPKDEAPAAVVIAKELPPEGPQLIWLFPVVFNGTMNTDITIPEGRSLIWQNWPN